MEVVEVVAKVLAEVSAKVVEAAKRGAKRVASACVLLMVGVAKAGAQDAMIGRDCSA